MTAMNVGGRRKEPLVFEPELVGGLNSMSIKKVACGDMFTACLTGKKRESVKFNVSTSTYTCIYLCHYLHACICTVHIIHLLTL